MNDPSVFKSKAALVAEGERVLRANRGLVSVIQRLMKDRTEPYTEVVIPIAELSELTRIEIVADNEKLTVRLRPEPDPH